MNSNIGRYDTCVRWCIEYQIQKINSRYNLFSNKIPYHFITFCGGALRYVISTHNHFGIGMVKSTPQRAIVLTYMKLAMKNWIDHPISEDIFKRVNTLVANKSPLFKYVETKADILKIWNNDTAAFWNLTYPERYIKGGGSGNIKKAIMALYQSKDIIQLYIGTSMLLYI